MGASYCEREQKKTSLENFSSHSLFFFYYLHPYYKREDVERKKAAAITAVAAAAVAAKQKIYLSMYHREMSIKMKIS